MKFETACVHGAYTAAQGETQVPSIAQSTTYRYYDTDDMAAMFDLTSATHMYTRLSNPNVEQLEAKMALLEGGVAAVAAASGQSASTICLLGMLGAGDHILSSASIYGGTNNLIGVSLEKLGIGHTFVDPSLPYEELLAKAQPNTKVVWAETLANPALSVLDFEKWSRLARELGVPLVVDNTLATPWLCRPLEHGADIVIHSTTKYSDGHGTSVGGMVIDGGTFDWTASDKYPGMTQPDESYHGIKYVEAFGKAAFAVKLRSQMLRDYGCVMSPMNAWLTQLGLQTLHLRMPRHVENAQALAEYLEKSPHVSWVNYPGLENNAYHALQQKYLPLGGGGVLTFGVKGGLANGRKFIESLKLTSFVIHVGDIRTSVLHPASTTHRQLSEQAQLEAGIPPELIRVSLGLENIEDVLADFEAALQAAVG